MEHVSDGVHGSQGNRTMTQIQATWEMVNAERKRVADLEDAIERAILELTIEETDPDDCRESVLKILRGIQHV